MSARRRKSVIESTLSMRLLVVLRYVFYLQMRWRNGKKWCSRKIYGMSGLDRRGLVKVCQLQENYSTFTERKQKSCKLKRRPVIANLP